MLNPAKTGARKMGITVTVHDTLLNYKTVGLFRSEEMRPKGNQTPHLERRLHARRQARDLAKELNETYG